MLCEERIAMEWLYDLFGRWFELWRFGGRRIWRLRGGLDFFQLESHLMKLRRSMKG